MIEFKTNLSRGERFVFAALLPILFAWIGWYVAGRTGNQPLGWSLFLGAAAFSVIGLAWPPLLRGLFVAWMALMFPIGWLMSYVILIMIYFAVITPVALAMRCCGFDPLHRRRDPTMQSYWEPHQTPADKRRYFRQF
ncbi:MAG: hypothetical protein RIS70_4340 [Planctomycetota bacterium]|jgi:hypothetical protein